MKATLRKSGRMMATVSAGSYDLSIQNITHLILRSMGGCDHIDVLKACRDESKVKLAERVKVELWTDGINSLEHEHSFNSETETRAMEILLTRFKEFKQ